MHPRTRPGAPRTVAAAGLARCRRGSRSPAPRAPCRSGRVPSRRLARQVGLQRAPHLRARAMQEHPLIGLRQVERVTNLLRGPAQGVAQSDRLGLHRRKPVDRPADDGEGLALEESILRDPGPIVGQRRPGPARGGLAGVEAIRDPPPARPGRRRRARRTAGSGPRAGRGSSRCSSGSGRSRYGGTTAPGSGRGREGRPATSLGPPPRRRPPSRRTCERRGASTVAGARPRP